jgi:hypothetical protein
LSESMCEDCKYRDNDSNAKPCNTCIQWTDGELDFTNYESGNYPYVWRVE